MNNDLQADFEKLGTITKVYNTGKGFVFILISERNMLKQQPERWM